MSRSIAGLLMLVPALALGQGGQPSITSVVFSPSSVAGGKPAAATITISAPAPNNGFEISLSMTSNVAQLAASAVTIGSGQTSATVQVATTATSTSQLAVLSATARGDTRTANLTITPPAVVGLTLAPTTVTQGQQSTGTITLDGAAPAGGTTVTLSSSSPAATVPAATTISQGQTSRTVSLSTSTVSAQTNATISATAGGSSRTATLTVQPPPISISTINFPSNARSADTVVLSAQASAPAPAGGLVVEFSTSPLVIPGINGTTAAIPAGQTSTPRSTVFLSRINTDRTFTITARVNGIATNKTVTQIGPRITSLTLPDSIVGGNVTLLNAYLDVPYGTGLPVVITSNNAAITSPGSTDGNTTFSTKLIQYPLRSNPVQARTPVTITVAHAGSNKTIQTVVVPTTLPRLSGLTASPVQARAGTNIVLTATIQVPAPSGGTNILLSATGLPAGMTIPASMTIPAGSTSASVTLATPSRLGSSVFPVVTARMGVVGTSEKTVQLRIDPGLFE